MAVAESEIIREVSYEPVAALTRDMKEAARLLTPIEARWLVDAYYAIQKDRVAAGNQMKALAKSGEPNAFTRWLAGQLEGLEGLIRGVLDEYTDQTPLGRWCKSIAGIGPVIAAGLIAHIDITKAPTAGHIWSFAGLNPEAKWEPGQKRPWNARLKVLCWKIGESFVKVKSNPKDIYGKIYEQRKAYETEKNERGEYADQAAEILRTKRIRKNTVAYQHYKVGKLPPGHIHARAKRYAVKIFLSHFHYVAYRLHYGKEPPKPYVIDRLGHADLMPAPNLHVAGLA